MLHYKCCNKLFCMDGVEGMKMLPDDSIPMVVTSPPWDKLRDFGGHPFHFEPMADQLWRVLMPGGVACWHVADQIKDHSESGTSARQNLYFHELGFCVNTLVVDVLAANARPSRRYGASLQCVFVLSKGRPRVFNPIKDIENRWAGHKKRMFNRLPDGTMIFRRDHLIPTHRMRSAIWDYDTRAASVQHRSRRPQASGSDARTACGRLDPLMVERRRCRPRPDDWLRNHSQDGSLEQPEVSRFRDSCRVPRTGREAA